MLEQGDFWLATNSSSISDKDQHRVGSTSYWQQLQYKERLLWKSRVKEGNWNNRFFYESLKYRWRNNQILSLQKEGSIIERVQNTKQEIKNHL